MDIGSRFKRLKFTQKLKCATYVAFKLIFNIDLTEQLNINHIEKHLIYLPVIKEEQEIEEHLKENIEFLNFQSDDATIISWYVKAREGMPTILYCHGQGENITSCQNIIKFLISKGYGVFIPQYRGHGQCELLADELALYGDIFNAVDFLEEDLNVLSENIILWGQSLGGAIAAVIASKIKVKALILESTFTSLPDLALYLSKKSSFSVLSKLVNIFTLTQKFNTLSIVENISCPVLIAHSRLDDTVPVSMAEKLHQHCKNSKLFISKEGIHEESEWVFNEVEQFLSDLE
ncbi:MAG: alpha/beta fold hydrolase [bacterium]